MLETQQCRSRNEDMKHINIWEQDPTGHLTCNVCASDVELCECKIKQDGIDNKFIG